MPHLKLTSSDFTVYFWLEKRMEKSEWVSSTIEVSCNDNWAFRAAPLWYFNEPESLLSKVAAFLQGSKLDEPFSLIDDPIVEFSFDQGADVLILRLYYSLDLADHLTVYLDREQAAYLSEYLQFYLDKTSKEMQAVQDLYDAGVFQGD